MIGSGAGERWGDLVGDGGGAVTCGGARGRITPKSEQQKIRMASTYKRMRTRINFLLPDNTKRQPTAPEKTSNCGSWLGVPGGLVGGLCVGAAPSDAGDCHRQLMPVRARAPVPVILSFVSGTTRACMQVRSTYASCNGRTGICNLARAHIACRVSDSNISSPHCPARHIVAYLATSNTSPGPPPRTYSRVHTLTNPAHVVHLTCFP